MITLLFSTRKFVTTFPFPRFYLRKYEELIRVATNSVEHENVSNIRKFYINVLLIRKFIIFKNCILLMSFSKKNLLSKELLF